MQAHCKELWITEAMVYYQGAYHVLTSLCLKSGYPSPRASILRVRSNPDGLVPSL